MGSVAGQSAGFGRIGGETRASLYTPFHLASAPAPAVRPTVPGGLPRLLIGVAVAVVVVVALTSVVGLLPRARPAPTVLSEPSVAPAPVLDGEAERLSRSAFAMQRSGG